MDGGCQPHEYCANNGMSQALAWCAEAGSVYHRNVDMGVNAPSRAATRRRTAKLAVYA
jgi:hypothetical protein